MKTDIFNLDIALKAVIADTAEMIYSDSAQEAQTGYFDDLHRHAQNLTKDMIEAILEKWKSDVFNSATFELEVQNATYADLLALQEALGYELGVESVFERSFENGVAILEVQYSGTSGQLGITLADLPEPKITVVGRSANKFRVAMVKGAPAPAGDTQPPVVTITSPANGASVGKAMQTMTVTGTVDDSEVTQVDILGQAFPVTNGRFTGTVELMTGQNLIEVAAEDAAGNVGTAEVTVTLDNKPPKLVFKILNFEEKTFAGQTEPGATLTVNGKLIPVDSNGNFKIVLDSIDEGELVFVATDAAGNTKEMSWEY